MWRRSRAAPSQAELRAKTDSLRPGAPERRPLQPSEVSGVLALALAELEGAQDELLEAARTSRRLSTRPPPDTDPAGAEPLNPERFSVLAPPRRGPDK